MDKWKKIFTFARFFHITMSRIKSLVILMLFFTFSVNMGGKTFTLVIDAGHGGHDAGAVGAFSKEKDLTLKYALAFGKLVEKNCPDVKVIYTRTTDRFLELWQRAEVANKAKADLFISIHINALPDGRIARGYQTYTLGRSRRDGNRRGYIENLEVAKRENSVILYEKDYKQHYEGFDPNSPESNILFELIQDKNMELSIDLAKKMQKYVCQAAGRQNKGVHQDNLAVLRLTSMPACLLELGFISTPDEESFLNSQAGIDNMARGIYNAFAQYKNDNHNGGSAPFVKEETKKEKKSKEKKKEEERGLSSNPQEKIEQPVQNVPQPVSESNIIYKVQILATDGVLRKNDYRLKGRTDAEYYKENGMVKYTLGSFDTMSEANNYRKELNTIFPGCFVVKFQDGKRVK